MDVSKPVLLSSEERVQLDKFVRDYNIQLNPTRQPQQNLGRDDFLKILITQLSYQDPSSPMEDKQFIAQMAQFSTLEQMTAMASDFSKLTSMLMGNEASAALGKSVEIAEGEKTIQGLVQAVTRGGAPQVLVNGDFYDWEQVVKVYANEKESTGL
ncbi:MAG: flagellar hook assembly protein FlgD [Treponema sp.]|nr:flagellar hook assembly protein FlgD [Treponema sp.]MCL2271394.1 flagellar hook assembly protein FlgD [Treponema sp.]